MKSLQLNEQKQITRGFYSLLTALIVMLGIILAVFEVQHSDRNEVKSEIFDYHLTISHLNLELIRTIDDVKNNYKNQFPGSSELASFRNKITDIINKIRAIQNEYSESDFKKISLSMDKAAREMYDSLNKVNSENYKDIIDRAVTPLYIVANKRQQLHYAAYKNMNLSFDNLLSYSRVKVIILIVLLSIFGLFGILTLFSYTKDAFNQLTNVKNDLKEREENFSSLTESMHGGVIVLQENEIVYSNKRMIDMLGLDDKGSLPELHLKGVVYHEDLDELLYAIDYFELDSETDSQFACRFVTTDDLVIPVEVSISETKWKGAKASLLIVRDITERHKQEQALQEFKFTLDQTLDCVFIFDAENFQFIYINQGAEQMVGYSTDELHNMHPYDIKPEFTEHQFREMVRPMMSGYNRARKFETIHQHKDGTQIPVQIFLQYIEQQGQTARFIAIARDITESKKSEKALLESESLLNQVMDITGEGIWDWDLDTNRVRHNNRWCLIMGLGKTYLEHSFEDYIALLHEDDRDLVRENINECLADNEQYICEYRMKLPNGSVIWVKDRGDVIERDENGKPLRMVGSALDITERKLLEVELNNYRDHLEEQVDERTAELIVARDEAQHANQTKSKFLSSMSHELRTPLNAILGFVQILEMDKEDFTSVQQENIKEILGAGEHLLYLINELLDLAKIESGKLKIIMEDVCIEALVDESIALIQPQADLYNIKIDNQITDKSLIVKADSVRLKQVILNLLSNAVKYNHDNGSITIASKVVENKRLRICVTDTGIGIDNEKIPDIFKEFERLNTEKTVEGTGVGLVITQQLVKLMGGSIQVESVPGKGSTFWIELELA